MGEKKGEGGEGGREEGRRGRGEGSLLLLE